MDDDDKKREEMITEQIRKHSARVEKSLKKITPALFSKFLIEKGVSQKCLSCGSTKIVVPESTDLIAANGELISYNFPLDEERAKEPEKFIDYVSYSKIDPERSISFSNAQYTVHCMNCGFMTQYKAAIVIDWLAKEYQQSKDDE